MLLDDLAEGVILRRGVAVLAEGRVVVVARGLRFVAVTRVCAVGVAEVCAAVGHVDAHRHVVAQHPVELFGRAAVVAARVGLAPHVEPRGIELSHEVRATLMEAVDSADNLLANGAVHRGQRTIDVAVGHLPRTVARDEGRVEARFAYHVAELAEIHLVVAVRAVFVLHLHEHDRAALGDAKRGDLLAEAHDIAAARFKEGLVVAAPHHALLLLQPIGIAAEVPFCAHVGTGAQHYVHAFLAADADKLGKVGLSTEIELARSTLVETPKYISGNSVDAHSLEPANAVAPILLRHAGIVHLAADKLDGLAFVQELPVLNLEILGRQLCRRTEEEGQQERKEFFHDD